MTLRMAIALASLVNALVSFYLHLYKLGRVGALTCGAGHGCEIAQFSSYGWFLGLDVALIGTIGWSAVFLLAVVGTLPRWEHARWPSVGLLVLVYAGLLFTVRLKYGEFIVLRTFCPWCFINVVIVSLCAVLAALDWRRVRSRAHDDASLAPGAA